MNHALLKSVIYDQHEFIRNFQIVPRDYEFEENGNYVLVGLRRAGKSTLLYKIVLDLVASGVDWEQIIYINFEDERLSEFTVADFNDILSVQSEMSDKKGYFFLDRFFLLFIFHHRKNNLTADGQCRKCNTSSDDSWKMFLV